MGYGNLAECVADLEKNGQLRRIEEPLDPYLELAHIQRRSFAAGGPALLFTHPKGCVFPILANLFGTRERVNFIFRDAFERAAQILRFRADLAGLARQPLKAAACLPALWHMRPKSVKKEHAPVLQCPVSKNDLPAIVSWRQDGGPFITLPLVYSEQPGKPGAGNLGMYRIQLAGNDYADDEVGLHYQLQRGIGVHHALALAKSAPLPVSVHVGGPPALAIAAVMPLPEGMNELLFAGLLGGRRMELTRLDDSAILAQADFAIQGEIGKLRKPEGPFGDHLGYYSLRHDFPVMRIKAITHRPNAIWPFTSVGRPPQEDTVFGDLIHELAAPMIGHVFEGVREAHAVDAAGVHPLLLAIGSERYTPYEDDHAPRELLTQAMHLLGTTQTALAKFVLIANGMDAPDLSCRNVGDFLRHVLERTDFGRDLHFFGGSSCDTLDYSGYGLHKGSRLIWAASGKPRRSLASAISGMPALPPAFGNPRVALPGVIALAGPPHKGSPTDCDDPAIDSLISALQTWPQKDNFPLIVIVDDPEFCERSLENFLWIVFTRADPARDCHGADARTRLKRWSCEAPLVIDARLKEFQAQPLEEDPGIVKKIDALAAGNGPLAGLF